MADETDPLLDGYIGIETFRLTDDDMSSRRIRDMPYGRQPKAITMFPEVLKLPDTIVGQQSSPCKAVLINAGFEPIDITELIVVGEFSISFNPVTSLAPGEKLPISVTFIPASNGMTTGGIYANAVGAAGDKFIKLTGIGYTEEV